MQLLAFRPRLLERDNSNDLRRQGGVRFSTVEELQQRVHGPDLQTLDQETGREDNTRAIASSPLVRIFEPEQVCSWGQPLSAETAYVERLHGIVPKLKATTTNGNFELIIERWA